MTTSCALLESDKAVRNVFLSRTAVSLSLCDPSSVHYAYLNNLSLFEIPGKSSHSQLLELNVKNSRDALISDNYPGSQWAS